MATTTAPTKTEDGVAYPKTDYAYTPDDTPSHWKLRLTSTPGGAPDPAIVGAAAAALGPGGFRGQKVSIPSADRAAVIAKVSAAWKKANPDKDPGDMPQVLKAAEADAGTKHTHAKAGGGKLTHTHQAGAVRPHGHDADDADNGSDTQLLPAVASMAEQDCAVMALQFAERVSLADPIDYMCTGEWTFPNLNNGNPITVTRDDLAVIKDLWDANAYGQQLPIIDEEHDKYRAVGWIEKLDWHPTDSERLIALPKWNPGQENLVTDGAYAHVSPVLLLNWRDPESGTVYPVVPGGLGLDPANPEDDNRGLAMSNKPKIKRLSARFVAAETTAPAQASAIALAEHGAVHTGASVAECVRVLLADPDMDGDDDGPVPCCIYQPPFGCCPGFTAFPGDTDGDGTCLLVTKGCNGYRAVAPSQSPPFTFSEESKPMADTQATTTAAAPATPPVAPPTASPPAPDLGEMQRLLAAERERADKNETELARLGEVLKTRDEDDKIRSVQVRLSEIAKRFPPAVIAKLTGPAAADGKPERAALLRLAEHPEGIDALETVPIAKPTVVNGGLAVSLSELGSGANADPESAYGQLSRYAEELRQADPKLTHHQAILRASEAHPDLVAAHRAERQRTLPVPAG